MCTLCTKLYLTICPRLWEKGRLMSMSYYYYYYADFLILILYCLPLTHFYCLFAAIHSTTFSNLTGSIVEKKYAFIIKKHEKDAELGSIRAIQLFVLTKPCQKYNSRQYIHSLTNATHISIHHPVCSVTEITYLPGSIVPILFASTKNNFQLSMFNMRINTYRSRLQELFILVRKSYREI